MTGPDLLLGVGNEWRRDDGIGPAVARACADRVPDGVQVRELDGEPARLVDAWLGRRRVVVVDASGAGREPGRITRIDLGSGDLPFATRPPSSHGLGIAEAVELGRALGQLPSALILFAVEGADFGDGPGLSAPVAAAVGHVARRVLAELTAPQEVRRVPG